VVDGGAISQMLMGVGLSDCQWNEACLFFSRGALF
jgi:hypothetical protein